MENKGVIYILTNPSFPEYVKIGYADDIDKRLKQLLQLLVMTEMWNTTEKQCH